MSDGTEALVQRCLAERREKAIDGLVDGLRRIADSGPEREPRPSKGRSAIEHYDDGYADAAWIAAEAARDALKDWEAEQ